MRLAVFVCILASCLISHVAARRRLKGEKVVDRILPNVRPVAGSIQRPADYCEIDVARHVEGEGFHRELVTRVFLDEARFTWCVHNSLDSKWRGSAVCMVHIEENFPSSVYIDPYELKNLEPHTNVRAFPRTPVDLELPMESAEPLTVDMLKADYWPEKNEEFYPIQVDYTMRVPFHVRYHAAGDGVTNHSVVIPPPSRIALKCVRPRLTFEDTPENRYRMKWPHGLNLLRTGDDRPPSPLTVESFLKDKQFISLIVPDDTPTVKFDVPVGNTSHKFFVSPVTSIVSVSAVAIVLLGILRTQRRMKEAADVRKAVEASKQEASEQDANQKKEN